MRRLTGPVRNDDRGAVAVLVVTLFAGGVLLGMLALVIDVGMLYEERRQLQSGSDAAAEALARACAVRGPECAPTTGAALADSIVDLNANDRLADIAGLCGTTGGLPSCPAPSGSVYDCGPLPASGGNYVQVRASTRTSSGTAITHLFTQGSTQVHSCSRATWGSPRHNTGMSVTISVCEWKTATSNGTVYAPRPPYPPSPASTYERKLLLHVSSTTRHCNAGPAGQDVPGGFGWLLQDSSGGCKTSVNANGTYGGDTGNNFPSACKTAFTTGSDIVNHQVVYIPVFDLVTGTGTSTTYHLAGFAPFVLTGWNLNGNKAQASWLTGRTNCYDPKFDPSTDKSTSSPSDSCIFGFFTQGVLLGEGDVGSGPDYGARNVRLIP